MKAVLLAAGLGTRLRPLTNSAPKCMVPVAGRPVLERNVEWLRGWGVTELAVNLHHRPDAVVAHFGDGSRHRVHMRYSHEPEILGTAGALRPLADWLDTTFVVLYADNLIDCDLSRLTALHERLGALVSLALFWREDVTASGVADVGNDGRVRRFQEKPHQADAASHWVNAGLLMCEPELVARVPAGFSDFGADFLPALLSAGEIVGGYRLGAGESLLWIDTPEDLAHAERVLRARGGLP